MSGEWGAKEEKEEKKGSKGTEIGREMETANFCHFLILSKTTSQNVYVTCFKRIMRLLCRQAIKKSPLG